MRKNNAAKELIDELDILSEGEKQKLKSGLDDLISDSPKTEIAILHFKKLMGKARRESYSVMKAIVIDFVTITVNKALFGN